MGKLSPHDFIELMKKKYETKRQREKDGIAIICDKLRKEEKIPEETIEEIMTLYNKVNTKRLSPESTDITLCAIVVIGCNNKETPVSIKKAAKAVGLISFVDLRKKYRTEKSQKTFLLNNSQGSYQLEKRVNKRMHRLREKWGIEAKIMKPDNYIERFCEKIGLEKKVAENAKKKIINKKIGGMMPAGVAAGAIRAVIPKEITIQQLVKITGIAEITIKKALRKIE